MPTDRWCHHRNGDRGGFHALLGPGIGVPLTLDAGGWRGGQRGGPSQPGYATTVLRPDARRRHDERSVPIVDLKSGLRSQKSARCPVPSAMPSSPVAATRMSAFMLCTHAVPGTMSCTGGFHCGFLWHCETFWTVPLHPGPSLKLINPYGIAEIRPSRAPICLRDRPFTITQASVCRCAQ